MKVVDHRLLDGDPVRFRRSPHSSSRFDPVGIVLHDTAGRLNKYSSVRWFEDPRAKASAHFVVERDGSITQCVQLNRAAWHAGRSSYRGRKGCNGFTFGIEIVNPGKMTSLSLNKARAWYGQVFDFGTQEIDFGTQEIIEMSTQNHGDGAWMSYTEEQIKAVIDICIALREAYPIEFITTHWFISPGRKVDTNPLFPLEHVRGVVFGRDDGDADTEERPPSDLFGDAEVTVNANMRRWPSIRSRRVGRLDRGTRVDVIRSGYFESPYDSSDNDQWHLCGTGDGQQGWIWAQLVDMD